MTGPTFPETYTNKDWPRRVRDAFGWLQKAVAALTGRVDTAETGIVAAAGAITALDGRVTALESETVYTVATVTFTPQAAPGSPVAGMTYFDSGTNKLRTYDGTIWNDHW